MGSRGLKLDFIQYLLTDACVHTCARSHMHSLPHTQMNPEQIKALLNIEGMPIKSSVHRTLRVTVLRGTASAQMEQEKPNPTKDRDAI